GALVRAWDAGHVALKFRLGGVREQPPGDVAGAIGCYRDILALDPGHEGARVALEKRLPEEQHQLVAAGILEPIYEKLEAWADLVNVHEIQLKHEAQAQRRVGLLMRIGELQAARLGAAVPAFDAFARAFREDPSRTEVRAELERIAPLIEDDGWKRLVELYEGALARNATDSLPVLGPNTGGVDVALLHELSLKVAAAYDERLENAGKAIEFYRKALALEP